MIFAKLKICQLFLKEWFVEHPFTHMWARELVTVCATQSVDPDLWCLRLLWRSFVKSKKITPDDVRVISSGVMSQNRLLLLQTRSERWFISSPLAFIFLKQTFNLRREKQNPTCTKWEIHTEKYFYQTGEVPKISTSKFGLIRFAFTGPLSSIL